MSLALENIPWPDAPATVGLTDDEVHVWQAALQVAPRILDEFRLTLSLKEKDRAARLKIDLHRHRFIAGRGLLRNILSRYLGASPAQLDFIGSPQGKPALSPESGGSSLHFNLAHTADLALLAVTRAGPVGIDVESVRPLKDMGELVARFFSPKEDEVFQKLPPESQPAAFFNLWTRKEAFLKATGEGIAHSLKLVEVSFLPGEAVRVQAISGDPKPAAFWSLSPLVPASGFVGALAIQMPNPKLCCWKFKHPPASKGSVE